MPKKKNAGATKGKKGKGAKKEMTRKELNGIKKVAEEKTFGMKNKNKSKKVQK